MMRHRGALAARLFVAVVLVPCAAQAQDLVQQQATEQTMMQQQIAQQMQESMVQQQMQTQELQMQQHMATSDPTVPEHLQIGNQQFDGSVTGFRKYLEDVKSADPKLYVQLAPDVARLESRQTTAEAALVGGLVLGLASLVYGIASRDDCTAPPVTDPSFAADSAAWSACNDRNMSKVIRFGLLGVGALVVGGVIAVVSWPGRSDLLDLVSKHNRLSKHPLQLQVGYDPPRRATYTGANVAF